MKTYQEIIQKYGSPLAVALALKIVTVNSTYAKKQRASARVCMWKTQNVPLRWQKKLAKLDKANAIT